MSPGRALFFLLLLSTSWAATTIPTLAPTPVPTPVPTLDPTPVPTLSPTPVPTPVPTLSPTPGPTPPPTPGPTSSPTAGPTLNPTPVPLQPYLSVGVVGTGTGLVTSSPPGISCPSDCTHLFTFNEVVTLTATPDPGSVFWKWTEASHPGCDDAMFMIDTTITCVASFLLIPVPVGPCAYNGDHPLNSCEACANWCNYPPNLRPQCACESVVDLCTGNGLGFPEFMDFAPVNSSIDSVRCGLNQPDSFCDCVDGQFSQYWSADPGPYIPPPTIAPPNVTNATNVTGVPTQSPTPAPTPVPTSIIISSEQTCQNFCDNMCGLGSNCTIYNQVAGLPTPPPTPVPTLAPTTPSPTLPPFSGVHPLNSCSDCFTWCLVSGAPEEACTFSTCGATYQEPGVCFSAAETEYCYCGSGGNATFKGIDGVCDGTTCVPINPYTMCTGLTECEQATVAPTSAPTTEVTTVIMTTTVEPTNTTVEPTTLYPTAPSNEPKFIWILVGSLVTIILSVALVTCCCTVGWAQVDEDRRLRRKQMRKNKKRTKTRDD